MSETKDLELLLKNMQKGLKFFSIKELSDAIFSFLKSKEEKSTEINLILNIVQNEFSISLNKLKSNGRGEIIDAKQLAYCLLHYDLGLSVRYISSKVFDNWPNSVFNGIKRLKNIDLNLKPDKLFFEKYKLMQNKYVEQLNS
jgi:chromosomal replication initiation ATPase DnaA